MGNWEPSAGKCSTTELQSSLAQDHSLAYLFLSPRIPHSPESPTQAFPPADFPTQPLFLALPPASYWSGETAALEQECRQSVAAGSLPPFPIHHGALGAPFSALQGSLMDEELLQAGIQASLQDMAEEEVKLSKSSVSSLR